MKWLALVGLFVAANAAADPVWYDKTYDPQYGVVCYKTAGGSLSCVKVDGGHSNG